MKIANGTLVLVADGSKFLLFRNEGDAKYPVLQTLAHDDAANARTHEQGTDRPGRTFASVGEGRSAYDETDWQQQAEDRFVARAAEVLERAARDHKDAPVLVAAAPRALGELRKHYGRETAGRLVAEIGKDLVNQQTDGIVEVLLAQSDP